MAEVNAAQRGGGRSCGWAKPEITTVRLSLDLMSLLLTPDARFKHHPPVCADLITLDVTS